MVTWPPGLTLPVGRRNHPSPGSGGGKGVGELRDVCYQDTGTCDMVSFGTLRPLVR